MEKKLKAVDLIVSLLVGGLFIFSGLIKVNDPIGTAIKMEEYFEVFSEDFAMFFHAFIPYALPIAFAMVVLEVVLGAALMANFYKKTTLWALLALVVFFTFLTFYSAYFNKVTDCGCFGDAIKLTPWESFSKDVVLLVLIGYLLFRRNSLEDTHTKFSVAYTAFFTLIAVGIAVYALRHLPPIDFRAYKVGDSIVKNMEMRGKPLIIYTYEKDGKKVESTEWLTPESGHKFVEAVTANEAEIRPKITDYRVSDADGNDMTAHSLEGKRLFIIIEQVGEANTEHFGEINALVRGAEAAGVEVMVLTADQTNFEEFRHQVQLAAPYYSVDATVLKTMIRSNPGIMILNNGVVKGQWHYNDTPTAQEAVGKL